jgi:transcription initiation factor TFIIE subunit alpha
MKLTNKLAEDVIAEAAGADTVELVNAIKNKKNISEFKIAELIKMDVNIVRNMLYRLYNVNLISFVRRKDKQKGWYIYYWTFNPKRIRHLYYDLRKKKLEKLRDRLTREKANFFFSCDNKCMRVDFDQATEFEYKCPECGHLMNQEDNAQKISEIEQEIKRLEAELAA